jgi:PAS domain S-box-containing protein
MVDIETFGTTRNGHEHALESTLCRSPEDSFDAHDHLVHFYEEDQSLIDSVAAFIGAALGAGEGAIVIATRAHREAIADKLIGQGVDLRTLVHRRQYVELDAAQTLNQFMVDGSPDEERFRAVVGNVIETTGKGRRGLRAFGEMVALLWADRNGAAALRLEELWNELARTQSFCLLCAYPLNAFANAADREQFEHICQAHSHVLPSENYYSRSDADRLREIATLQQKAAALEAEILRRKETEEQLRRREDELTTFIENASVGLHWVGPDGIIQWANQADYELLGYGKDEYIGHNITEFHADAAVIQDILDRLTGGERLLNYEARLKCKDGGIRTVLIDSCVLWNDGQFVHTQCFTRDITEQKRAEAALHESKATLQLELEDSKLLQAISSEIVFERKLETLYQKLVDAAVVIMRSDFASMQMYCPERGDGELRLLANHGFAPEAVRGWQWVSRTTPSSCGETLRRGRRVLAPNIENCEFLCADGLAAYRGAGIASMQSTPLLARSGELVGMISTHWRTPHEPTEREFRLFDILARQAADLIEERRAEIALRESEERYRQLVSLMPAGVYTCDQDGRINFFNHRASELWGREPNLDGSDRFCGSHKVFTLDGKYVPPEQTPMAIAIREGRKFRDVEATVERPDGSRFTACVNIDPLWDSEGRVCGAINVFQDITERKSAEEGAARLAAIIENSDDAIFSTDLDDVIKSWNRGAEQLYGYSVSEAVGQPIMMLIPQQLQNEELLLLERIRNGETIKECETERRRKNGTIIDVSLTLSPVKDASGRVIGISKVARDITDKVRAREILEQTVEQRTASLREAVEQMEEFSYSVSHDLRAPLRSMRAYADVLLDDYAPQLDATGKDYLEKIRRSSERMDRLTRDVLIYSRVARAQVQPEPISLETLISDVIHQYSYLQPPAAADIEIVRPLHDVLGHEVTLGQCVANLLNNAVKFVPPGVKPRVRIHTENRGKFVRLSFADNGIGIKPEHQSRIFKMFERLHPDGNYEGTGIGLTIVRKAIEKMGGKVGVDSDGQNGTCFWLELRRTI